LSALDAQQAQYQTSNAIVRGTFGNNSTRALEFYSPFVNFVEGLKVPKGSKLLDVGCGCGWSTYAFAQTGYAATGIDLNPGAFEPPPHPGCTLKEGNALRIDFPSESFDLVVCINCLEHLPNPRQALDELTRVCKPGGKIAITSPNLLSPTVGLLYCLRPSSWKSLIFFRRKETPKHPYGNTIPETFAFAFLRAAQLMLKLVCTTPVFSMREADTRPPFFADNDACYLCNPTDLIRYFKRQGFKLERRGKPNRPPLSYLFAGGTWIAAQKPAAN